VSNGAQGRATGGGILRNPAAADPGVAGARVNAAYAALRRQAWGEAERLAREGLHHAPDRPDLLQALGLALRGRRRLPEALELLRRARDLRPDNPWILQALVATLIPAGRLPEAIEVQRQLFDLQPAQAGVRAALVRLLIQENRTAEAARVVDGGRGGGPEDDAERHCLRGEILAARGRHDAARAAWARALELDPGHLGAAARWSERAHAAADGPVAAAMRALVEDDSGGDPSSRRTAAHVLGNIEWSNGHHARALAAWGLANALFRERALADPDTPATGRFAARGPATIEAFPDPAPEPRAAAAANGPRPVFITGMPRSGKTLVESLLCAAPGVAAGGECNDSLCLLQALTDDWTPALPDPAALAARLDDTDPDRLAGLAADYLRGLARFDAGAAVVTQTLPAALLFVGAIRRLLPQARFVFCLREPADLGLACHAKAFTNHAQVYATDLHDLGREIRAAEALIAHWQQTLPAGVACTVRYEDLVGDPAATLAPVRDMLGLPPPSGAAAPLRRDFIGLARPLHDHLQALRDGHAGAVGDEA